MSVRLPAVWRAAPLILLLLPLGCAPARDQFAPACPAANVLPTTGDIVLYRNHGSVPDLTDVMLQGQVAGIQGRCRPGSHKNLLDVAVRVSLSFTRGPAMRGDTQVVPIFVAVTEGGKILDKKVYRVTAHFPANMDHITYATAPVDMILPVSANKSGSAYTILAGFQLTRGQLATNRARAAQ